MRRLVIALALMGTVLFVAVPSGASTSSQFGATVGRWVRAHGLDQTDCAVGPCYGPLVDSHPRQPEFSFVQTMRNHVVGYDEALRRGTSLGAAELEVVEQFPGDVSTPHSVTVIHRDRFGASCAVFDLYSQTLAKEFGSKGPAGQGNSIGVELTTVGPGGTATYNPDAIDLAIIVPEYLGSASNC